MALRAGLGRRERRAGALIDPGRSLAAGAPFRARYDPDFTISWTGSMENFLFPSP